MNEYNKAYGTVNTDAEREEIIADKVARRLSGQISGMADDAAQRAVSGLNIEGILQRVAGKLADSETSKPITAPQVEQKLRGKVTGPGYSEEFSDWRQGTPAYEALKKRMIKARQTGTVKFFTEDPDRPGKWGQSMSFKVNEDAFE